MLSPVKFVWRDLHSWNEAAFEIKRDVKFFNCLLNLIVWRQFIFLVVNGNFSLNKYKFYSVTQKSLSIWWVSSKIIYLLYSCVFSTRNRTYSIRKRYLSKFPSKKNCCQTDLKPIMDNCDAIFIDVSLDDTLELYLKLNVTSRFFSLATVIFHRQWSTEIWTSTERIYLKVHVFQFGDRKISKAQIYKSIQKKNLRKLISFKTSKINNFSLLQSLKYFLVLLYFP